MPNDQTKQVMIPNDNYFSPSAWNVMVNMANVFIKSQALPAHITNASQLLMILQTGKEMGLKPMQAINGIYILKGKVSLYSHVMLSKILEGGVKLKWLKDTPIEAEVEFSGLDRAPYVSKFTIAEAQKAGLVKPGGAWVSYPGAMLRARAVSAGARVFCPDLISGAYTLEEVADVEVDKNGNETLKAAKDLDAKPIDPNHAIRVQIKNEIARLGGNPSNDEVFGWVNDKTALDLHDPGNFPAILQRLSAMPTPNQKAPEPPKQPETSPEPPKPAPESAPGAAIIEEVDQSTTVTPASPSPAADQGDGQNNHGDAGPVNSGAKAFDRALAPKASEPYLNLFKNLLEQKYGVPRDAIQPQLTYLEEKHQIFVERLAEVTQDEIKVVTEVLTKIKVDNQPAGELPLAAKEPSSEQTTV